MGLRRSTERLILDGADHVCVTGNPWWSVLPAFAPCARRTRRVCHEDEEPDVNRTGGHRRRDAAGMSAAHQALRGARARGHNLEVVVLERTHDRPTRPVAFPTGLPAMSHRPTGWSRGQHDNMPRWVSTSGSAVRLRRSTSTGSCFRTPTAVAPTSSASTRSCWPRGARPVYPQPWAVGDGGLIACVHPLSTLDDGRTWLDLTDPAARAGAGGREWVHRTGDDGGAARARRRGHPRPPGR